MMLLYCHKVAGRGAPICLGSRPTKERLYDQALPHDTLTAPHAGSIFHAILVCSA